VRFDLPVPGLEEMSRDELIVVVRRQAGQITAMAGQLSELMETNEALSGKLARLEHLLSRNSGNSSNPPSKDDDPGKPAPPEKNKRDKGGPKRARGKQPGAAGTHLAWTENPDERRDRFPQGRCDCGDDLGGARDLGIVDRYQQHEIPQVAVKVTQYDQHQVECGCGKVHTAQRPDGARSGPVGYGPLCRTRHNGPYAERPVMPRWGGSLLVVAAG
jgi:transposase